MSTIRSERLRGWLAFVIVTTSTMCVIAIASIPYVNRDAIGLVVLATLVGTASGLASAYLLLRGHSRVAGFFLIVSSATPTYGAAALNLLPLGAGLYLLLSGRPRLRGDEVTPPDTIVRSV